MVKSMTRKFQPRLQCIQSATGENLTEAAQIANRWKGYGEDLCCDEEGKGIEQEHWEQEPPPFLSEVARAISQTASRKATGPDEVPAELFKAGETVLDRMHRIYVAIWETGEWPEEWTFSTLVENMWNSLPNDVVEAGTIHTFKNRLVKYWSNQDLLSNCNVNLTGIGSLPICM